MVAGAAALIWDLVPDANGDGRKNDDVAARLFDGAEPVAGTGTDWRWGRLDVCRSGSRPRLEMQAAALQRRAASAG